MEKTVSLRKMEANRRNALRSAGPRTAQGKRKARWNALKHGLLSQEVVIPIEQGNERGAEFARLLAQLRRDLRPRGVLEEMQMVESFQLLVRIHERRIASSIVAAQGGFDADARASTRAPVPINPKQQTLPALSQVDASGSV